MIPYNPSSFDTNKTILEQILELKKWLQAHPSYEIFYSSEAGNTSMPITSYDLTAIADSTNMEVGDVVIFHNVTVGVVTSIDRDNNEFGCDTCVSFKGDTGATGSTGPAGANGTCIRKYNGNASSNPSTLYSISDLNFSTGLQQYDLIYFNNGYAGFVSSLNVSPAGFYIYSRFYVNGKDGAYIDNVTIDSSYHLIVYITDPNDGSTRMVDAGSVASSLEGVDIQSTGVTSGKVLTADGSGGASWEDASGGGGANIFTVLYSSLGSPLSDSDYAQAVACDVLKVDYGSSSYLDYVRDLDDSTKVTFIRTYNGGVDTMTLTKGTKTIANAVVKITGTSINSGSATSGQVLTADGSGGSSWQTAGGSTLYQHNIKLTASGKEIRTTIISDKSTAYNNAEFNAYIYNNNVQLMAFGVQYNSGSSQLYFTVALSAASAYQITERAYKANDHTYIEFANAYGTYTLTDTFNQL